MYVANNPRVFREAREAGVFVSREGGLSCRGHLTQTEGRDGAGTPREGRCYRKGKEASEDC